MTTIGVVGGGAAGVMVVAHLARQWREPQPPTVLLYDSSPRPARGAAYSTAEPHHLLNVPAGRMSAVEDDPEHFVRWLRRRDPHATAEDFRARCDYGDYLADTLAEHSAAVGLVVRRCRVTGATRAGDRLRVEHTDGADAVDAIVLALGHAPPARPAAVVSPDAAGFIADPWAPGALRQLADITRPGDTVLTLGCGLTAVDVALTLSAQGRRVVAVSRHGLLPSAHHAAGPAPEPLPLPVPSGDGPLTAAQVTDLVRAHVERAVAGGLDWRAAVDGVRPVTTTLWRRLPVGERRAFLAGAARHWEVLRHRMAPEVAQAVERMAADRAFTVVAGELIAAVGEERRWRVTIRRDGIVERMPVAAVVNCTGPTCDIEQYPDGLGQRLVDLGLVVSDPLGLGVQTASDGAVIDATGRADGRISALGPLRRGELYESTAVPELRAQAAQIAATLVELPARSAALAPYPHGAPSRSWAATHGAGVGRPA